MSINLNDFVNMLITDMSEDSRSEVIVYVFSNMEERKKYRKGRDATDFFSISSNFQLKALLKEKYATAKVLNFFAYDKNVIDVIVDLDE